MIPVLPFSSTAIRGSRVTRTRHARVGDTVAAVVLFLVCASATPRMQDVPAAAAPPAIDAVLVEARNAYDATEYEHALTLLDSVIAGLGNHPSSGEHRQVLIAAYELRARTRINLDNFDGARNDFRAILLMEPAYLLSTQVGLRVLPVFEEVRQQTVGSVSIVVTPADAQVMLGDTRLPGEVRAMTLVGGIHTLSAARAGYKPATRQFAVVPGEGPSTITLELERISSTLAIVTSPANITIVIDGITRGVTELDPQAKSPDGSLLSKPFLVTDVTNGRHKVEFRRECFIGGERDVDVQRPGDYTLEPVKLTPAIATVMVNASTPGATVFVDDAPRGPAPMTLDDICQGPHTIEVRTGFGRHVRRMDLQAGDREVFAARIRPAFALVTDSGASAGVVGGPDLRRVAETTFQNSQTVTLFAPDGTLAAEALAAENLPADWLWFDVLRRPQEGARTIAETARGTFASRISRKLNAQGIAAVAREPGGDPSAMLLILLAPGSTEPDVFRWRLDDPESVRRTLRELDQTPAMYRLSIGVLPIDVEDVDGAVVAATERGANAEKAGLAAGDIIVRAGNVQVRSAVDLQLAVSSKGDGQVLPLQVQDHAGVTKTVDVLVEAVPNVVSLADRDLPANTRLVEYTYRTSALAGPLEEAAVRLNVAALSMRLKNRTLALQELKRVIDVVGGGAIQQPLSDAIAGTAQYLTGVAAEATGDMRTAEAAWRQALQSDGTLLVGEGGDAVKVLSERRLHGLSGARTSARP